MFGFIAGVPRRIKNILSKFKKHFTKPQFQNFCRTELGLITAGKKEHDVKSINDLFIDPKDQSSLNRFITESNWDVDAVAKEGVDLLLTEAELNSDVEYKVIDDTVCKKYGSQTEMTCYNHSSTMGTILSHDYVTSLYLNNGVSVSDGLKLFGSERKCKEKGVDFKTRAQLACELICEHISRAKQTINMWDPWFMCQDTVKETRKRGHNWIGEIKSNRMAFYDGKKYHLHELVNRLRSEGCFCDVVLTVKCFKPAKLRFSCPRLATSP